MRSERSQDCFILRRRAYTPAMPSVAARLLIAGTSHIGLLFGALALTQFWLLNAVTDEGSQPMLSILVRGSFCRCTMYPPILCVMCAQMRIDGYTSTGVRV